MSTLKIPNFVPSETKGRANRRKKIFGPIAEEVDGNCLCKEAHKQIFKRCHNDLVDLSIGIEKDGPLFKSSKKLEKIVRII